MKRPFYPTLEGKLAENGISYADIAEFLQINQKTVKRKMSGKSSFSWDEVVSIRDNFFPGCSADILMGR